MVLLVAAWSRGWDLNHRGAAASIEWRFPFVLSRELDCE